MEKTQVSGGSKDERPEHRLLEFSLPSQIGNEQKAMERVAEVLAGSYLKGKRLDRMKTAVAEATMNAIEHGNRYCDELPVSIEVLASAESVTVEITDHGSGAEVTQSKAPDIDAKMRGDQEARGWGMFLIEQMVDEYRVSSDGSRRRVELVMHRKGESNDD